MERIVKERLIGAAVLMAAAIILVPEMLTGPQREEAAGGQAETRSAASTEASGAAPIKTYRIDLQPPAEGPQSTRQSAGADAGDGQPPAPARIAAGEDRSASPAAAGAAGSGAGLAAPRSTQPQGAGAAGATARPQTRSAMGAAPATAAAANAARPAASAASGGWAVQVGSFAKQDTARQLAAQLRLQGHEAFVMPVQAGSGTLYRVRVGPMKERSSAEAKARQLQAAGAATRAATVVAQP